MSKRNARTAAASNTPSKTKTSWHSPKVFEALGIFVLLVAWILDWHSVQAASETQQTFQQSMQNINRDMNQTSLAWQIYSATAATSRERAEVWESADYRRAWVQQYILHAHKVRTVEQIVRLTAKTAGVRLSLSYEKAEDDLRIWRNSFTSLLGSDAAYQLFNDPIDETAWRRQGNGTYYGRVLVDIALQAPTREQLSPQKAAALEHQFNVLMNNHALALSDFSSALARQSEKQSLIYRWAYGCGTLIVVVAFLVEARKPAVPN